MGSFQSFQGFQSSVGKGYGTYQTIMARIIAGILSVFAMVLFVSAFMKTRDRDCLPKSSNCIEGETCKQDDCQPKRHYEWILFSLALIGIAVGIVVGTDWLNQRIQADDNFATVVGTMAEVNMVRSFIQ